MSMNMQFTILYNMAFGWTEGSIYNISFEI